MLFYATETRRGVALRRLPAGYVLIDYSYTIRDRDVTSSMRVMRTRFPGVHAHPVLVPAATARTRSRGARVVNIDGDVLRASRAPAGTRSRVSAASGSSRAGAIVSPVRFSAPLATFSLRRSRSPAAHDNPSSVTGSIQAALRPFVPIDFYNNA